MASIQRRADGYRVRVTRKGYQTLSKTFKNRQEALKWARNTETQIDDGRIKPSNARTVRRLEDPSFEEAALYYLSTHTPLKRNSRSEAGILKNLITRWGVEPLNRVNKMEVARLRDEMVTAGRSPSTIAHHLNAISVVFRMVQDEWGVDIDNPTRGVKRPKPNPPRVARLSDEAVTLLLKECDKASSPLVTPIVKFALETGMRRGEILAIKWEDIDWENKKLYLNETKNGESRCIPASNRAIAILKSMPNASSVRIFPIDAEALRKCYERAVRRAARHWADSRHNPFENLTFHDLRHQALSQLSDLGLNVIELAEISGHKTLGMLKRYTHPLHTAILRKINSA